MCSIYTHLSRIECRAMMVTYWHPIIQEHYNGAFQQPHIKLLVKHNYNEENVKISNGINLVIQFDQNGKIKNGKRERERAFY